MDTSKTYLIGNWKMHMGPSHSREMISVLCNHTNSLTCCEVWLAVPSISIPAAVEAASSSSIRIGAQNVHWEKSGAFTGELSIPMIKEAGASFALSGHSERRHVFGESNELAAKRTLAALRAGFTIIHCIGETLQEREQGKTYQVLKAQLEPIASNTSDVDSSTLLIAYEPVWAIGTGKVAGVSEITDAHSAIDSYWQETAHAACPPILYGGSVSPDNFTEINKIPKVAGGLIGGASLVAEKFAALIEIAEQG